MVHMFHIKSVINIQYSAVRYWRTVVNHSVRGGGGGTEGFLKKGGGEF